MRHSVRFPATIAMVAVLMATACTVPAAPRIPARTDTGPASQGLTGAGGQVAAPSGSDSTGGGAAGAGGAPGGAAAGLPPLPAALAGGAAGAAGGAAAGKPVQTAGVQSAAGGPG